jgi:hypothetical protein
MSDEELENLRAILAKATYTAQKPGILGALRRALARFFTRPKKTVGRQIRSKDRDQDVA